MHLSTRARYAVMAMADLARAAAADGAARAVSLGEIASRQSISLAYLEQIFARLRRGGLVVGARGPGGGYVLARSAREIAVFAVIAAVDEPLEVTRCREGAGCAPGGARCLTHGLWDALGAAIARFLSGVTLADVVEGRFDPPSTAAVEPAAALALAGAAA